MCIRDSPETHEDEAAKLQAFGHRAGGDGGRRVHEDHLKEEEGCLLYTSDAADERSSVDLGGRRIIKKHKRIKLELCARNIGHRFWVQHT